MARALKPREVVALRYFANGLTPLYNASISTAVDGWCNAARARRTVAERANVWPRGASLTFLRLWRTHDIKAKWWWQEFHFRWVRVSERD